MAWWKKLLSIGTGGLVGQTLWGGGSGEKKKDPYADLLAQLAPYLEQNKKIATQAGTEGLADIGTARKDLDYVSSYLKKLFEGSDDDLLKLLDAGGATRNIDENEQQLSEFGVRGGRRAASLGQLGFNRDASLNNLLKQLRFSAPDKIANIAQILGNMGLGELSASQGSSAQASNVFFGIQGLREADKDRKAALIGSIIEAIGGAAGAFFGSKGG